MTLRLLSLAPPSLAKRTLFNNEQDHSNDNALVVSTHVPNNDINKSQVNDTGERGIDSSSSVEKESCSSSSKKKRWRRLPRSQSKADGQLMINESKKRDLGRGNSGGLGFWWRDVEVNVVSYSSHHCAVDIINDDRVVVWRAIGIYGWPDSTNKHRTWSLMKNLKADCTSPCLMFGEFNEIISLREKEGGAIRSESQMDAFRNVIDRCSLKDLGFKERDLIDFLVTMNSAFCSPIMRLQTYQFINQTMHQLYLTQKLVKRKISKENILSLKLFGCLEMIVRML
ncbi:Beta-galactosidase bgaB [Bienertia sinuspersici]